MKKIVLLTLAAALMLCSCGKRKEDEGTNIVKRPGVVSTALPQSATEKEETPLPQGTVAPIKESDEVKEITVEESQSFVAGDDFLLGVEQGHKHYTSGDGKWGIELPSDAVIKDTSDGSAMFSVGDNIITAVTADKVTRLETVSQIKEHYSGLGDIKVSDLSVIRDNGEYKGCFFEFLTSDGMRGFAKYVTDGKMTVSAAAVNMTMDAAQNEILRETVSTLAMLD